MLANRPEPSDYPRMLMDVLLLALGLGILVAGGEAMVRGASALAHALGISPLAIGLTVVAFGTSAPELAVNVGAALSDSGALSFGNIFGSNMANIGLIVGLTALIVPLPIHSTVIQRELPMMLLAMAAAAILALDQPLGGERNFYQRGDGLILLLFFIVFLYYTVGDLLRKRNTERNGTGTSDAESSSELFELPSEEEYGVRSVKANVVLALFGLAGLIGGAELTVTGAVSLAQKLNVPEVVIGLTLVSVGTSLPELATALIAVRHKNTDLAVGTVVGSNIFNVLLVCGVTATISPMPIPPGGRYDLAATALLCLMLTVTSSTHRRIIIRYEGLLLLSTYLGYMIWRAVGLSTT
jgi:cation:H+ antiporter